jgi:predicted small integral membrane protein
MGLSWMAWTWQTATFFIVILVLLILMVLWEKKSPGGGPRKGILSLNTTRGDRLFISLLSAAFIHLAWLYFAGTPLLGAGIASILFALFVFRFV